MLPLLPLSLLRNVRINPTHEEAPPFPAFGIPKDWLDTPSARTIRSPSGDQLRRKAERELERDWERRLRGRSDGKQANRPLRTFFEKHLSSERINIYSEEHAVIGFGAEGICRICEDRISVAERLRFIAPSAEVIIVIRNQLSIIPSYWTLRTEGNGNVNSWISHEEERVFSELDLFLYSEIVNVYQEFFGVERVHVLLYEDLLEDPDTFVHQLCVMLGVDPRIGTELTKGRWIAKTRESAEMILKPSACEFLERRYCADNQKLQENTGLDLASHGYPH